MSVPVCTECGLCCIVYAYADQNAFCNLCDEDIPRIPKQYRRFIRGLSPFDRLCAELDGHPVTAALATKVRRVRSGPLKDTEVCACALLRGDPLLHTRCAIYKNRPQVCRTAVVPGDRTCVELRRSVKAASVAYTKRIKGRS